MEFQVGSIYSGFQLLSTRYVLELQSTALMFLHENSGARLLILHNDDDNKVFSISFRTPPTDSTGVAHILEHSVLCGSRKFPVKEPFIELIKGSLNTFLNAMTFSDKTMYPLASRNAKDFDNLMDVYLDAVFFPSIYSKPEIFMQEGWHYELNSVEDEITYNGVVYNEMKGAFSSPTEILNRKISEVLFPDTAYGVESGGDPDWIPNLTYEEFLEFHKNYYHPSNSYIYLYGDFDIVKKLEFLDKEYLSRFNKQTIQSSIKIQAPFLKTKEATYEYPVSASDSLEDKTVLSLNMVTGKATDAESVLALQILEHILLETSAAPLKKALLEAEIGKDVFGSFDSNTLQPIFSIGVLGSEENKQFSFLRCIYSTLQKLVIEGIDEKLVESAVNFFEFHLREANFGNYPKGLIYCIQCMSSWLYDSDPLIHLEYEQALNKIKTSSTIRYFETIIEQVLMENTHRALVILRPVIGLAESKSREIEQSLAEFKSQLSLQQLQKMVDQTMQLKHYQSTPDSNDALQTIPMIELSDIDKLSEKLPTVLNHEQQIPVLYHNLITHKICYSNFYFDTSHVQQEKIPYVFLLAEILAKVATRTYSYSELANEININTGGITFSTMAYSEKDNDSLMFPKFKIKVKVLEDKIPQLFTLLKEILIYSNFEDKKRLKEIIQSIKSDWSMNMLRYAQEIVTLRALSYLSPVAHYNQFGLLSFYDFVHELDQKLLLTPDEIIGNLKEVADEIFNRNSMVISVTGDTDCYSKFINSFSNFAKELNSSIIKEPTPYDFSLTKKNEGLMISAKVQYVAQAANFRKKGFSYSGALKVLETLLCYDYLWNRVRVKGGAYGSSVRFSRNGNMVFSSYRDPNLKETLDVYKKVADYIENLQLTDRELKKYIIGTMSQFDRPLTSQMKGERADEYYFKKYTDYDNQIERNEILMTTEAKLKQMSQLIKESLKENAICVLGNEEKIKQNQEMFNEIINVLH